VGAVHGSLLTTALALPAAAPGLEGAAGLLSPERLAAAGLLVLALVVFAETGLLAGFFLPGDSLLLTAGLLVATGVLDVPILLLCGVLVAAAVLGDQTGYTIGRASGPRIFARPESRLFKPAHVERGYAFFERYGGRTIVIARFVPLLRTVAPVVAGASVMDRRTFTTYNVVGGVLWAGGLPLLGYWLGRTPFFAENLERGLLVVVAAVVLPVAVEAARARRRAVAADQEPDPAPEARPPPAD
jgi:membrane-associated protein